MRVILVPVADRPECAVALESAFRLAERLGGSVMGCHMRPGRAEHHGELLADVAYEEPARPGTVEMNSRAAHGLFEKVARERGFDVAKGPRLGRSSLAIWHTMVGTPALTMQIAGPVADLVVLSRPAARASGPARAFLLAGLLHSGTPALVLPQEREKPIGKCAVIAWNQGFEAAAAVKAAMPMLQRADEVLVVNAGPEGRAGPRSTALVRYLKHWGVKADRMSTPGRRPDQEIQQAFRKAGGDVLIMGAYSRPRMRELVFGGMTEHMLFGTDIPVFLYHR